MMGENYTLKMKGPHEDVGPAYPPKETQPLLPVSVWVTAASVAMKKRGRFLLYVICHPRVKV